MYSKKENKQESPAIAGRTARCRCKFRYIGLLNIATINFGGIPLDQITHVGGLPEHKP